jgi:hypothetical protein
MSFVSASSTQSGKAAPTFGQLYQYGAAQQRQFQCGWDASYLQASKSKPLSFAKFGHAVFQPQAPNQPSTPQVQPSQLAAQSSAPTYFMAGRAGCGFVNKAVKQHRLQKRAVTELDCFGDDAMHPVCQLQAKHRRGTPMYYKQTGNTYELVKKGYSPDVSFLPPAS